VAWSRGRSRSAVATLRTLGVHSDDNNCRSSSFLYSPSARMAGAGGFWCLPGTPCVVRLRQLLVRTQEYIMALIRLSSPEYGIPFRLTPDSVGLEKLLGPLEVRVMQIIWQGERTTVKRVHRQLAPQHHIAYTTVMTTMSRLAEKGILNRHRQGLAYIYTAAITEDAFVAQAVEQVMASLMRDYPIYVARYLETYLESVSPTKSLP
jgi:predicted transcriptional regulator